MGMDYSLVQRIIDGYGKILDTKPGSPDEGTYVTEQKLADWIKGQTFVTGYYHNGAFYSDLAHTNLITPQANVLYADLGAYGLYAWDGAAYQPFTPDLSPYATKAEMQAADTNLNNALQATNKRVTNLEQKAGDELTVNYPDSIYGMDEVPANVAEYAKVSKLRGVSRVENQLIPISSVESQTVNGVTWTNNGDGSYTANGTATANSTIILQTLSVPSDAIKKDHVYLLNTGYTDSTGNSFRTELVSRTSGNQNVLYVDCFAPSIVTPLDSGLNLYVELRVMNGKTANNLVFRPTLTDLTLYFGGTIPSDADTIAEIQTNYPHLLTPSEYGTRIVDSSYTGVRAEGVNLFNPYGTQVTTYGTATISDDGDTITVTASYYVEIKFPTNLPTGNYYARWDNGSGSTHVYRMHYTDNTYSSIYGYGVAVTAEKEVDGLMIYSGGGTVATAVYNNFQFAHDDSDGKTVYHRYRDPATLSLPSPVELRSAGSVHQIYYPETGEMTEPLGSHTFDGTESWILENDYFKWNGLNDVIKRPSSTTEVPNLLIIGFLPCPWNKTEEGAIYVVPSSFSSSQYIWIKNSSIPDVASLKTYLNGKTLIYELATPDPNSQATDPMPDPFIKVEGGGTIRPVQSQTTQIDSSMSVDYLGV